MREKIINITPEQLSPYVSVSLVRNSLNQEKKTKKLVSSHLLDQLSVEIATKYQKGERLIKIEKINESNSKNWTVFGAWFKTASPPFWFKTPVISDIKNHLVLIGMKDEFVAIASSDGLMRKEIVNYLTNTIQTSINISPYNKIDKEILSSAFLRGDARETWLKGVHRPIKTKPDSKTLIGADVREALDPFSDNTFKLSAALSDIIRNRVFIELDQSLPEKSSIRVLFEKDPTDVIGEISSSAFGRFVGLSFKDDVIWTRTTQDLKDFLKELNKLCYLIKIADTIKDKTKYGLNQKGYEFLQQPINDIEFNALGKPFDFSINLPLPDAIGLFTSEHESIYDISRWHEYGSFKINPTINDAERLYVDCYFDEDLIARLRIQPIILMKS